MSCPNCGCPSCVGDEDYGEDFNFGPVCPPASGSTEEDLQNIYREELLRNIAQAPRILEMFE